MYHWKNILFISAALFGWIAGPCVYAQLSEVDQKLIDVVANEELHDKEICKEAMNLILFNGADLNAQREDDGFTVLHIAAERGLRVTVMMLLREGADETAQNEQGLTARQLAREIESQRDPETDQRFAIEAFRELDDERTDGRRAFGLAEQELILAPTLEGYEEEDTFQHAVMLIVAYGAHVNAVHPYWGITALHSAVKAGHMQLAAFLIRRGVDVNIRDLEGRSPLDIAVVHGRAGLVTLLLREGADVRSTDRHQRTPLHLAAQNFQANMIAPLLVAGVPLKAEDCNGWTALDYAAEGWHIDTANALRCLGLNEADRELLEVVADEELDSQKICDLAFGLILVDGANINAQRESDGFTALHIAAERGLDLLTIGLLRAGADAAIENWRGRTALQLAEAAGQAEIVAIFEDMEDPDEQRRFNVFSQVDGALFEVILDRQLTEKDVCDYVFELILIREANVNAVHPDSGDTPLHRAAQAGNPLLVRGLIRLGADVNVRNHDGLSPIDIAALNGHQTVAVTLAEAGADLTGRDFYGMTPLHVAAQAGHTHMILPLLLAGVQLEAQDYAGRTALYYAARENQHAMAQALRGSGAGAYQVNYAAGGGTPLHVAVREGDIHVAEYFIGLGADMNAVDVDGFNPYGRGNLAGREEFVQLFEDWGFLADVVLVIPDADSDYRATEEEIQACIEIMQADAARREDRLLNPRRIRIQEAPVATRVTRTHREVEDLTDNLGRVRGSIAGGSLLR